MFEQKRYKPRDFTEYLIFKGFQQKILIFGQHFIPNSSKMLNATTHNHEVLPECATYVYFKSPKVWSVQPPTTMKFCQNVPHMYILKA